MFSPRPADGGSYCDDDQRGYASWHACRHLKKEAGFHKIISWLKRKDRLAKAISTGSPDELFDELIEIMSKSLQIDIWKTGYITAPERFLTRTE